MDASTGGTVERRDPSGANQKDRMAAEHAGVYAVRIRSERMKGLLAYLGPDPCPGLLQDCADRNADSGLALLQPALLQAANARSPVNTTEIGS